MLIFRTYKHFLFVRESKIKNINVNLKLCKLIILSHDMNNNQMKRLVMNVFNLVMVIMLVQFVGLFTNHQCKACWNSHESSSKFTLTSSSINHFHQQKKAHRSELALKHDEQMIGVNGENNLCGKKRNVTKSKCSFVAAMDIFTMMDTSNDSINSIIINSPQILDYKCLTLENDKVVGNKLNNFKL